MSGEAAMRCLRLLVRASAILALASALGPTALGQVNLPAESIGGPLTGPPILGAPFSADATTTVHAILGDGSRLDQTTTDRYYRDSAGRVRVERPLSDLPAPTTVSERHIRTIIDPDPGDGRVYTLDAQTRTARSAPRSLVGMTAGGGREFLVPVGGARFLGFRRAGDLLSADPDAFADVRDKPLGSQPIAGVDTTGRRVTLIVPAGYKGHTQPGKMIDERWESAELNLLIQSWHSDSRSTIEYQLSNIRRTEPPARLFEMPPDYTMDFVPTIKDPWMSFASADSPRAGSFLGGRMAR
jgi:hypothetical protein